MKPAPRGAVYILAVTFLIVVGTFAWYATNRADIADHRAEAQRAAICAILANIRSPRPLPAIENARRVFARPGHAADCQPISEPKPGATPAPTIAPSPAATVVIVPAPASTAAQQTPHGRRRSPQQHPTHTRSPRPNPRPSPTPTRTPLICQLAPVCR